MLFYLLKFGVIILSSAIHSNLAEIFTLITEPQLAKAELKS